MPTSANPRKKSAQINEPDAARRQEAFDNGLAAGRTSVLRELSKYVDAERLPRALAREFEAAQKLVRRPLKKSRTLARSRTGAKKATGSASLKSRPPIAREILKVINERGWDRIRMAEKLKMKKSTLDKLMCGSFVPADLREIRTRLRALKVSKS